jgi:hypothetical protein
LMTVLVRTVIKLTENSEARIIKGIQLRTTRKNVRRTTSKGSFNVGIYSRKIVAPERGMGGISGCRGLRCVGWLSDWGCC